MQFSDLYSLSQNDPAQFAQAMLAIAQQGCGSLHIEGLSVSTDAMLAALTAQFAMAAAAA
jgi:hypothetical protein